MNDKLILNPSYFWEEWLKTMVILQRPAVQLQLFTIIISLAVMFLISQWIWRKFQRRYIEVGCIKCGPHECYVLGCRGV